MTGNVVTRCGCESMGLSSTAQKAQNYLVCLKGKFNAGILASKYKGDVFSGRFRVTERLLTINESYRSSTQCMNHSRCGLMVFNWQLPQVLIILQRLHFVCWGQRGDASCVVTNGRITGHNAGVSQFGTSPPPCSLTGIYAILSFYFASSADQRFTAPSPCLCGSIHHVLGWLSDVLGRNLRLSLFYASRYSVSALISIWSQWPLFLSGSHRHMAFWMNGSKISF